MSEEQKLKTIAEDDEKEKLEQKLNQLDEAELDKVLF